MEDLKTLLKEEQLTCIIRHQQMIYKAKQSGVLPLLHFIEEGLLKDSEIADKVIGKAAAMLMIYGGASSVHANIISEHALSYFKKYPIVVTYDRLVPFIINRKKDGMCPMEQTVLPVEDCEEAYHLLLDKCESHSFT